MARRRRPETPDEFIVTLSGLNFAGEATGRWGKQPVAAFGALPGETVRFRPLKRIKRDLKIEVEEVLSASPERIPAQDSSYPSSSPWQILALPKQHEYKLRLVQELFRAKLPQVELPTPGLTAAPPEWGYRNKMEFSLGDGPDGPFLAQHLRYRYNRLLPITECRIVAPPLMRAAHAVIEELGRHPRAGTGLDSLVKSVVVRGSSTEPTVGAALFVTEPDFTLPRPSSFGPEVFSWRIFFSDPKSPASVASRLLYNEGELQPTLSEQVAGVSLHFAVDGFFQTHVPGFAALLAWVGEELASRASGQGRLLDLYSGVGTIGLALANQFREVTALELDPRAAELASANALANRVAHYSVLSGETERHDLRELLPAADVVVVDPPRSGLHPRVVRRLVECGPPLLVYVSCNPLTQAHDLAGLSAVYRVESWRLFDLYPHTPHAESVLVLARTPAAVP